MGMGIERARFVNITHVERDIRILGPRSPDRERFQDRLRALIGGISKVVVASEETVRYVLLSVVSRGHLLLDDTPGVGKTLMAKALAGAIGGSFSRVQCTPDLLPSDITGTSIFDMRESRFEFRPGPVFCNILLADEINRTTPRTQSALLEAMAESQVSADGRTYPLPAPFMVIATQNLLESHGVFPLPDSQLDRFFISMSLGLPDPLQEVEILSRDDSDAAQPSPVVSTEDILAMQDVVRQVSVALPLKEYMVNLARASRAHPMLVRGVSPRGTVLLRQGAQGWAAFEGRSYVVPEDIKQVAPLVLPHRVVASAAAGAVRSEIVEDILQSVPVPL